jgi:5-methylcytosine-specific restriction endonuclease McrA
MKAKNIKKETFIEICKNEMSMAKAASTLGLHFNTFKKYALEYGCYIPNQSGKGLKKDIKKRIQNIEEYSTRASVRKTILKENLIEYKCGVCGIYSWNEQKLSLHLNHINGKNGDHRLENLRWLCPNCHSQTSNYTGRNK